MAIEGQEQQEQQIPEFNPESFLSDDNEVYIGSEVNTSFTQQSESQEQEQEQEQEEQEEQEQEQEEDISYDDDFLKSPEVEEEEKEFNPDDYKVLSETLGVEINSKEDLENIQSKIKGTSKNEETVKNENYNFLPEEQKLFDTYNKALEGAKKASNEEIMAWHLKQLKPEKYKDNPEELEYHIDNLKDMDLLDEQAEEIRKNILSEISSNKEEIVSKSKERETNEKLEVSRELETELKKHKEGFHGINMNAKSLKQVFDKVRSGSIFEEIESSQANVAEFALLWENRELFYKAFEHPDTSVGIRKMMDELQNSKAKPAAGKRTLKNPYVFDPEAFLAAEEVSVKGSQS